VYDAVIDALLLENVNSQVKGQLLESVIGILKNLDDSHLKLRSSIEMNPSTLLALMDGGNYDGPAREFMGKFTACEWINILLIYA